MPLLSPRSLRTLLPLLPAIATLLLLGLVLWANDRIVASDLTERAHYRVAQNASIFADRLARLTARRSSELLLTVRILNSQAPYTDAQAVDEMRRLQDTSTAYEWIGLTDGNGHIRASTHPLKQAPQPERIKGLSAPFGDPSGKDTPPQLVPVSALWGDASPFADRPMPLGAMAAPVRDASGQVVGFVLCLLQREYFESMRQSTMGAAEGRRSLDLQLATAQGDLLLGDPGPALTSVTRAATQDLQAGAALDAIDTTGRPWLMARTPVRPVDSTLMTDWVVVARQPIDAATAPADRLQTSLLLWGLSAALVIGGLGMWMSRRISQPYKEVLDIVAEHVEVDTAKAPGAYLSAASEALRRLAPMWRGGDGSQILLDQVVQDAQRLQQVLEQLPTPVYLLDAQGRVTLWNRQAEAVFGWPKAQAIGRPIGELVPGEVHSRAARPETDAQQIFEARSANREGQALFGEWHLLPLTDDTHKSTLQGQIVLMRDITDRVRAAATLAQHEADLSDLTQRLMEQEQVTTRRLAQTLHDQLGQTLGAIRLSFDALASLWKTAEAPRHQQRAQTLDTLVNQAIGQVRQALVDLRPPLLEEQGLAIALDNEIRMRQIEAEPVELCFDYPPEIERTTWPPDVAYAAFMVAREAIGNALQHAQCNKVVVDLQGGATQLQLRIEDDGIGLPGIATGTYPGHLGLVGMRERALAIGARLEIQAVPSGGLVVQLTWPATPSFKEAST